MKAYFGKKVTLYYQFLGNYSFYLIFPSFIGFIIQIIVWASGNANHPSLPFFAVFICLWSIFMLESWKRSEKRISLRWGMENFEEKELDRPHYTGELIRSYIDGEETKYFPKDKKTKKLCKSMGVVCALVLLVIGTVFGIYVLRFQLQRQTTFASSIASLLNTVQITIFNLIYAELSVFLTKYENHRTDTQYEDSMITKLFAFQFINSYSSFFFLAFIASYIQKADTDDDAKEDYIGQCGATSCMDPLALNIAIIFGSRITVTNAINILTPYFAYKSKRKAETEGVDDSKITKPEEDYMLMPYDTMQESINEYADTAIQYGFMTLFITALPIACLFALLTNIMKVKMNAWKLFTFYQRPVPQGTEDIGNWQAIFDFVSTFGVLSNGAIICFTMRSFHYTTFGKAWVFIGFQWGLLSLQYIIGALIPDVPNDVVIQLERTEFIVSKLIDKVADEDYDPKKNLDDPINSEDVDELDALLFRMKGNSSEVLPDIACSKYPSVDTPSSAWPKTLQR